MNDIPGEAFDWAKSFVRQLELERRARQQEAAGGETERGGVLPALGGIISGGSALRMAASVTASASKRVPGLLPPALSKPAKSFLPAALGSKLGSLGKRSKEVAK